MDSVSAFNHAVRVIGSQIVQVSRLNGANSVWECTSNRGPIAVIKNYARDHHSEEHFFSETFLVTKNDELDFLPVLMNVDRSSLTAVFEYEPSTTDSAVKYTEIIQTIQEFSNLTLPAHLHIDPPGIYSSWANSGNHLGIAENLVLAVVKKRTALSTCIDRSEEKWKNDTTIHGDLKLANIRLQKESFKIIDWETVGFGSKYWDIAGLTQSIVIEIIGNGSMENWARNQIYDVKQQLTNADQNFKDVLVTRLVQSALEAAQKSTLVPKFAAAILQLAEYLANDEFDILETL